jgi:hypothetical protein
MQSRAVARGGSAVSSSPPGVELKTLGDAAAFSGDGSGDDSDTGDLLPGGSSGNGGGARRHGVHDVDDEVAVPRCCSLDAMKQLFVGKPGDR